MEVHSFFSRNFSVKAWYVVVDVISLLCSIWDHLLVEICHLTGIAVGYFFHLSTIGGNKIVFHCKKKIPQFSCSIIWKLLVSDGNTASVRAKIHGNSRHANIHVIHHTAPDAWMSIFAWSVNENLFFSWIVNLYFPVLRKLVLLTRDL